VLGIFCFLQFILLLGNGFRAVLERASEQYRMEGEETYATAVLQYLGHSPKEGWMTMQTTVLVLRIKGRIHP